MGKRSACASVHATCKVHLDMPYWQSAALSRLSCAWSAKLEPKMSVSHLDAEERTCCFYHLMGDCLLSMDERGK